MKTISVVIPVYNEEENVIPIADEVVRIMTTELSNYDYEIIFIDNNSHDKTRGLIRQIAKDNKRIKAIFNTRNFGQNNSPYHAILQANGDAVIPMSADFQDPPQMIPKFVEAWENGAKLVIGKKTASKEGPVMYLLRTVYYRLLKKLSRTEIIEHFTGFGLYDRDFVEFMRSLRDPIPFMRGVVAEYGGDRTEIPFEQEKRRGGKTHNNFFTLYDIAMRSFTSYTKFGLRVATFVGAIIGIISLIIALFYLIYKITHWYTFNAGVAPLVVGVFFIGAVQLLFLGLMGEYILSINERVMNRPMVVEKERINFDADDKKETCSKNN